MTEIIMLLAPALLVPLLVGGMVAARRGRRVREQDARIARAGDAPAVAVGKGQLALLVVGSYGAGLLPEILQTCLRAGTEGIIGAILLIEPDKFVRDQCRRAVPELFRSRLIVAELPNFAVGMSGASISEVQQVRESWARHAGEATFRWIDAIKGNTENGVLVALISPGGSAALGADAMQAYRREFPWKKTYAVTMLDEKTPVRGRFGDLLDLYDPLVDGTVLMDNRRSSDAADVAVCLLLGATPAARLISPHRSLERAGERLHGRPLRDPELLGHGTTRDVAWTAVGALPSDQANARRGSGQGRRACGLREPRAAVCAARARAAREHASRACGDAGGRAPAPEVCARGSGGPRAVARGGRPEPHHRVRADRSLALDRRTIDTGVRRAPAAAGGYARRAGGVRAERNVRPVVQGAPAPWAAVARPSLVGEWSHARRTAARSREVDVMMRGDAFEGNPESSGGGRRTKAALTAGGLVTVLAVVGLSFCTGRGTASPEAVTASPTPQPTPTVRAVTREALVNGVRLWDDDRVAWLSFYHDNQDLLGQPLGWTSVDEASDDEDCAAFDYYVVCHVEDEIVKGLWEYAPLTLGSDALTDTASMELDAPLAPTAVTYIDAIKASGRDAIYWFGRSISRELCSAAECIQYFERAVLRWPSGGDVVPDMVSRSQLGRAYIAHELRLGGSAGVAIE